MMRGILVENGQFAGSSLDWLHPFPILTGIGLVFGYALLGAGWLVLKTEGGLRDWAYARIRGLVACVVVVLGLAFAVAVTVDLTGTLRRGAQDLSAWPLAAPTGAAAALASVWLAAKARWDCLPFTLTAVFFVAAFATLVLTMWPYMIPYALTVADAAAPEASLRFFFYAGIAVLPVIAIYTICVYWVFRGKTARAGTYGGTSRR